MNFGAGYVGSSADGLKIRRLEDQRKKQNEQAERVKAELAAESSKSRIVNFSAGNSEVIENAFAQTLLADDEGFVTVDELRKLFTYQTAEQTDALSEKEFSDFCNMFGIGGASSRIPLDVIKRHPCWEEAKVEM